MVQVIEILFCRQEGLFHPAILIAYLQFFGDVKNQSSAAVILALLDLLIPVSLR